MYFAHQPVMAREVIELLTPVPTGLVVDATVGGGGHAHLLLTARPDLRLLGIDRDGDAVAAARERLAGFGDRARVVRGGFHDLATIVANDEDEGNVMGVLFDLGVSSPQIDRASRGFSYMADAPLDMRMDTRQELTAATVVNEYDVDALTTIIATYGEERFARQIAKRIVAARPVTTTGELVDAITAAIPAPARRKGPHPAKRTFQAIRMEVNRELESLADGLVESVHLLAPEGRVLVLAYHSLEDRIVKRRFANWSGTAPAESGPRPLPVVAPPEPLVRLITRKPVRASEAEATANPRSTSVRLRAVERLA